MAQFSFKDYDLTLDFPTCTFTVRCDSDYSDKIKNMGEEFTGLSEKLIKGEITKDYAFEKIKMAIDQLLGDGAYSQIFQGRDDNFSDASDVLIIILSQATTFFKQMKKTVLPTEISDSTQVIPLPNHKKH